MSRRQPSAQKAAEVDDYGEGDRLDRLMEERFKYGLEIEEEDYANDETFGGSGSRAGGLLGEDDDGGLNDETFGVSNDDVDANFDFTTGNSFFGTDSHVPAAKDIPLVKAPHSETQPRGNQEASAADMFGDSFAKADTQIWGSYGKSPTGVSHLPPPSGQPSWRPNNMLSVEEIEAQMHASRQRAAPPTMMSVEELEAQLIAKQRQQQAQMGRPMGFPGNMGGVPSVTEIEAAMMRQNQMGRPPPPEFGYQGGPPGPQFNAGPPQGFPPNQFPQGMRPPQPMMGPNGMMPPGRSPPMPMHGAFPHQMQMNQMQQQGPGISPHGPAFMGGPPQNHQSHGFPQQPLPPNPQGPSPLQSMQHFPPLGSNPPQQPTQAQQRQQAASESTNTSPPAQFRQQQQQQQHQSNRNTQFSSQQAQSEPLASGRSSGRQEYGQMRYGGEKARNNQQVIQQMTSFASPKGPAPYDGGWGGRRDKLPRWERYADTMTKHEMEVIAKIQISQLVTDNPARDDFYYYVYNMIRRDVANATANMDMPWQQVGHDKHHNKGNVLSDKLQQQMQKLIEGKKPKAKSSTLALEGALGKVSLSSVKNPRQVIQVNHTNSKDSHNVPKYSHLTRQKILRSIENAYDALIEVDYLQRSNPQTPEEIEEVNTSIKEHLDSFWAEMGLAEPVPFNALHPFALFLSISKGKKFIPRIVRYLSGEQMFTFVSTMFARAESLDVCNMPAGTEHEAVDLFMATVIPPVVSFVSEVPLGVVNTCMRILLERHDMVWLAKSKAGLAFLTLMLSRAEILKNAGGSVPPTPEELTLWGDLYNFLFTSLHTHFASIFPPPPTELGGTYADDVYVWQFLAAMAVGATTIDHQRILVGEVRLNVIETSRRANANDPASSKALANVNLFLNALGLGIDASQLAAMG